MNEELKSLSVAQLKAAVIVREKIECLEAELAGILGSTISTPPAAILRKKKRGMSAAGRSRVAAAQRARWAKLKAKPAKTSVSKPKRKMSASARAKMAAAARKRWAAAKAAGKSRL